MWLCFFFSSRRRHTRWPRDWSSDVCSSDLAEPALLERIGAAGRGLRSVTLAGIHVRGEHRRGGVLDLRGGDVSGARSEERRVGKGGGCWRSAGKGRTD